MIPPPIVPAFDGVSPDDWKSMLSQVELSDPSQMQMAGVISQMMAGVKSKTGSSSVMFLSSKSGTTSFFQRVCQDNERFMTKLLGSILTPH